MTHTALLALEDGSVFWGQSVGIAGQSVGEVIFNTAMSGYQEILTDPSYCQQLVTLTQPHIGNVGVNTQDEESARVQAGALIIRQLPQRFSNWRAQAALPDYLQRHRIPAIAEIDTRRLTRRLRDKGAQRGCILAGGELDQDQALQAARAFPGLKGADLAKLVSTRQRYEWHQGSQSSQGNEGSGSLAGGLPEFAAAPKGGWHVVAYDFGVKRNILRILADAGCRLTVVPAQTPAAEVLAERPHGVFLSNGPGDPQPCEYAIAAIREIVASDLPVFGICLGYQLLALALGAKTVKMKFGHHGANHPVQELASGQVMISSQNHGFAVAEASLPAGLQATHRSLFDGSLQGVRHSHHPAFGFQGHPEASPGPHDLRPLFEQFIALMQKT